MRLIAGALKDKQVARDLLASGAKVEDFALPGLRSSFVIIEQLMALDGAVSQAVFATRLTEMVGREPARGVLDALNATDPVSADDNITTVVDHMRQRVAVRRLGELGRKLSTLDEWADPRAVLSDAEKEIREISTGSASLHGCTARALAELAMQRTTKPLERIAMGLGDIDDMMTGGAPVGYVTLFKTGSGMGKTTYARHALVGALSRGVPCLLYGNESLRGETAQALTELLAGVRIPSDITRDLSADHRSRIGKAAGDLSTLPLWVEDAPRLTVEHFANAVRVLKRRMALKLVVIDYLQDIGMSEGFSRDDHLSHAHKSNVIRRVAQEEEVAIIALSQLGAAARDAKGKAEPDPEAVAGGRIYYRDAGAVVDFKRDAFSKDEKKRNVTHIRLQKDRLTGRAGAEVWMRYDVQTRGLAFCDAEGRDLDTKEPEVVDESNPW